MPHDVVLGFQGSRSTSDSFEVNIASIVGLQSLVLSACEDVETVDWATLMVISPHDVHVVGDEHVREIEALQCAENDGPVFEALRTRRICRIPSTASSPGWTAVRELCRRYGVMSMASLPIIVEGVAVAILNLYSCDYHAFGPAETRTALHLAEQASRLIAESMSSPAEALDQEYDELLDSQ